MKYQCLAAVLLVFTPSNSFSQSTNVIRAAQQKSGMEGKIRLVYQVGASSCNSYPVVLKIKSRSKNGKIRFSRENVTFNMPNSPCAGRSYQAQVIFFTPDKNYKGSTNFEIEEEAETSTGNKIKIVRKYEIEVR